MATKLGVFNSALLLVGERFLASLSEEREPRRLLDHVWDTENGVRTCLEEGQWHFAMRTVQLDYDPDTQPDFGYNRAFVKPSDWVLTSAVCSDEFFRTPLTRYTDETGFWYSDIDTIYVRYVSDSADYGKDLGKWPESFREFVSAHFANRIALKLSNDEVQSKMMKTRELLKRQAKGRAAMAEPTAFPAQGNWSRSRNRFPNRRDGGNTSGGLIG